MSRPSEEISKYNANSGGKTDSNLANDALHLGGIEAEEYATKKYVQDYHDNKEISLKEYIDRQDNSILQESKAYVDKVVQGQDFSDFAKMSDIKALDDKLSQKIEQCGENCANNLDTRINQVVADTNANFDDINKAITNLNNTSNELFTSVSNGKKIIAEAITDKGVATSANDGYNQMATNIRKITTIGSGGIPEGYINTDDATATASDILKGKTAYVKGEKVYGQYIGSNDAESGTNINPDNNYQEYASVRLIYSSQPDSLVRTKIATINEIQGKTWSISGDGNIIAYIDGSNLKFLRAVHGTNGISYVSSMIFKNSTTNESTTYTSPVFSLSDLGIDGTVRGLAFSKMNTKSFRSSYECKLAILTSGGANGWNIYVFTMNTNLTNGSPYHICTLYNENDTRSENQTVYRKWKIQVSGSSLTTDNYNGAFKFSSFQDDIGQDMIAVGFGSNNRASSKIYIRGWDLEEYFHDTSNAEYGMTQSHDLMNFGNEWQNKVYDFEFYNNNRLMLVNGNYYITIVDKQQLVVLDNNKTMLKSYEQGGRNAIGLTYDGLHAIRGNQLNTIIVNYTTGACEFKEERILSTSLSAPTFAYDGAYVISNGDVYTLDFNDGSLEKIDANKNYISSRMIGSQNWLSNTGNNDTYFTKLVYDNKVVSGLEYNGQLFYKQVYPSQALTAKQEDVAYGKTFIGWLGIPEAGTKQEVNE